MIENHIGIYCKNLETMAYAIVANPRSQFIPETAYYNTNGGQVNSEYSTNIKHYKQVIRQQGNEQENISPYSLLLEDNTITIWTRSHETDSSNEYPDSSIRFHWKKEEELLYYFIIDEVNENPQAYVIYQEKKINMDTGKTMYFKIQMATPFILKKYGIKL